MSDSRQVQHVYPLNDPPGHDTDGTTCACRPKVKKIEGGTLVIHNSWDGREITERAIEYVEQAFN